MITDALVPGQEVVKPKKKRLHDLDWLRAMMVISVVYAHIFRAGVPGGMSDAGPVWDNHAFYPDNSNYEKTPIGTRWVSIIRQWCLPMLFYVSGAAAACSYKGRPRGLLKLLLFTILGMGLNFGLWELGPRHSECDIGSYESKPECSGLVFDFLICPWAGNVFPILFQMWYTAFLLIFLLLSWPLMSFLYSRACGLPMVGLQFLLTSGIYGLLVWLSGSRVPSPGALAAVLICLEAAFLAVALLADARLRPQWLPLRLVHYGLGLITVLQFGCSPIVQAMTDISAAFILFILVGFLRFFHLGYIMTRARLNPGPEDAEPFVSRFWPLAIIILVVCAPSTNWFAAGNLTYPYWPAAYDRGSYVAGAVVVVFFLDRVGRSMDSEPLPNSAATMVLLLYLLHPLLISLLLLAKPLRNVNIIWFGTMAIAMAISVGIDFVSRLRPNRVKAAEQSASEAEDSEG